MKKIYIRPAKCFVKPRTLIIPIIIFLTFLCNIKTSGQVDPYLLKDIKTSDEANAVCFFPDGKKILVGLFDGTAKIIDLESEKTEMAFQEHWKGIMAVDVDPNGKFFMTAGDNTIKIWDYEANEISRMPDHTTTIYSAEIHPSGKYLVSGAINKVFKFWDIKTGKVLYDMKGHTDVAMAVAFSNDGKWIASGSGDNTIRIWETGTNKEIMSLKSHLKDIYSVTFSHDDRYLASCSKDKTIRIYDLEKAELYKVLTGHKNFVMDIAFAPGDLHLVSCSFDKEIRIWEIPTGKSIYTFIDHDAEITDICFAPDGNSFASASHDKTIKIWEFSPEIFVDYYYSDEVIEEMAGVDIFQPRKKGESRSDYEAREMEAQKKKKEIYDRYYSKYMDDLKLGKLTGKQ
jgi:WD40 repeat protein